MHLTATVNKSALVQSMALCLTGDNPLTEPMLTKLSYLLSPYDASLYHNKFSLTWYYYDDFIMGAMAYQITSLTIVDSIVYSDEDQRKHQSSASLAFVRTNGQLSGKCFHLTTSSCHDGAATIDHKPACFIKPTKSPSAFDISTITNTIHMTVILPTIQ